MWVLSFPAVAVTGLCAANTAVGEAVALLPREEWMPIPGGAQGWDTGPWAELVGTPSPQQEVGSP